MPGVTSARAVCRASLAILLILAATIVAIPQVAHAAGNTVVSLTFNDGLLSQYQYGRPVLQAHNMLGTFYVSSKVIEASATGYMATWHVDDLYRDGDEIGGITKDHVDLTDPTTTTAYKQDQVCGDKARLAQLGYDPQSFSYPYAAVDPGAEAIVQGCGYLSGRTVGGLSTTTGPYAENVPTLRGGMKWRPSSIQAASGYRRPGPDEHLPRPKKRGKE